MCVQQAQVCVHINFRTSFTPLIISAIMVPLNSMKRLYCSLEWWMIMRMPCFSLKTNGVCLNFF